MVSRRYISRGVKYIHPVKRCFVLGHLVTDGSGRWRNLRNGRLGNEVNAAAEDALYTYAEDQDSIVVFEALSSKLSYTAAAFRFKVSTRDPTIPIRYANISASRAVRLLYRSSVRRQFEFYAYILKKCNSLQDPNTRKITQN